MNNSSKKKVQKTNTPIKVAFLYDFDGTLAPGNMHEHGFIEKMGLKQKNFGKCQMIWH